MPLRLAFVGLLALALGADALAQVETRTLRVIGQVVDARTGLPIAGALIDTHSARFPVRANATGRFRADLRPRARTTVSARGYVPVRLTVRTDRVTEADGSASVPRRIVVRLVREPRRVVDAWTHTSGWPSTDDDS
ncbi:MAG: hypothetical protein AAF791_04745 [Bacteroidota bacterium]